MMFSIDAVDRIIGAGEVPARSKADLSGQLRSDGGDRSRRAGLPLSHRTHASPSQRTPGRYEAMCGMASTGAWKECAVGLVPMHARLTNNFVAFFAPPAVTCST